MFFVKLVSEFFQDAPDVSAIRRSALVNHIAKDQHLAGAENVGRRPVERIPVDSQTQIAFTLSSKTADGRTIKGEIVPALQEKLFVIVEHVQSPFKIAE